MQSSGSPQPCCTQTPTAPPSTWQTIQPIAQAVMPWVLVIIGWWVVHRTSVLRALRQEELGLVADIEKRIEAVRGRAIAYYTKPAGDSAAEASHLKHEVQAIIAAIGRLRLRKPKYYEVTSEMIELRAAVTGGTFESSTRQPLDFNDPIVLRLWLSSSNLVDRLREDFEKANR